MADVDGGVGAEERQVAVRGSPLRAVRVQVNLRQGVHETPDAGAKEVTEGMCNEPGQGRVIGALEAVSGPQS